MVHPGRATREVVLTDGEREALERWERRPKSAQALALRCRIVLACAEGATTARSLHASGCIPTRFASGATGSWSAASKRCTTSPAQVHPARSPTTTSSRSS